MLNIKFTTDTNLRIIYVISDVKDTTKMEINYFFVSLRRTKNNIMFTLI